MNTVKKLLVLSLTFGSLPLVFAEQPAPQAAPAEQSTVCGCPTETTEAPCSSCSMKDCSCPKNATSEATAPAAEEKAEAVEAVEGSENQPSEAELQDFLKQLEEQVGQANEEAK